MKRTSLCNKITLTLMALCICAPLALTNTSTNLFLDTDNRYAEEIPSFEELSKRVNAILGIPDNSGAEQTEASESPRLNTEPFDEPASRAEGANTSEGNGGESQEGATASEKIMIDTEVEDEEASIVAFANNTLTRATSFLDNAQAAMDKITSHAESYLMDRIGFRNEAMTAYILGNDIAFHIMTHPDYDYGLDGHLFHAYDFYVAPDDYLDLYANYVVMLSDYCKQRGIPFLYVNTPSKEFVYDDLVPDYVPLRKNVFDTIQPLIDSGGVEYLDLTDCLRQAREEGTEVFNRFFDTGHFNTDGAFIASNAILQRLAEMGINVEQADLSDYYISQDRYTHLPASAYPLDIDVDRYLHIDDGTQAVDQPEYKRDLEVSDYSTDVWNWTNPTVDNNARLLMFQGSYFCSQGTSLYHQFSNAALVRAYVNVLNAAYYIDVFQPNVVVFEAADYTIRDGYYNSEDLERVDLPPVFSSTFDPNDFTLIAAPESAAPESALLFDPESAVTNFSLPYDASSLDYAYAQMNGKTYECVVRENDIFWGVDTKTLTESQQAIIYLVKSDGTLEKFPLEIAAVH